MNEIIKELGFNEGDTITFNKRYLDILDRTITELNSKLKKVKKGPDKNAIEKAIRELDKIAAENRLFEAALKKTKKGGRIRSKT